jgi:hypothetical protein
VIGFLQGDLIFFLAAILAVPIFGIWDAWRLPSEAFARTGRSRTAWIVVQVAIPVFGTLSYYAFVRPSVRANARFDE